MQRLRTAIVLVLACCLFSTSRPAIAQPPSSTFTLELRFATPAARNPADVILTVRIGTQESETSPIGAWSLPHLAQYIESWRDQAIDLLIKQLHIA